MKTENLGQELEVIAGHCSVNPERLDELYEMAEIQTSDGNGGKKQALSAVRFVGIKSRTERNAAGNGMGIDFHAIEQAMASGSQEIVPPSVLLAERFVKDTGLGIAAEIMLPGVQLPFYEGRIPKGKFMPWNPAVDQLGWSVRQMAEVACRNNWTIGLKNGKWLGEGFGEANKPESNIVTSMEKTWLGLATFAASSKCRVAFIHRGVDIPEKGNYRNVLIHGAVKRLAIKAPLAGRFFDPSHSLGPKLRDKIVEETVEAMSMKVGNDYLYTGILVEAGTSETDTNQHISVDELRCLIKEISRFRRLKGPLLPTGN